MTLFWFAAVVGLLAGAAVGSFLVTSVIRAERGEQVILGRSHCDGCGRSLSSLQTLPLVGYLHAGGVCQACGGRIDPLHLAGEMAGGAIGVATALLAGSPLRALTFAGLGFVLLVASTIDMRTRRLPNALTALVGLLGVVLAMGHSWNDLVAGIVAALVALIVLYGVSHLYWARRGETGLGLGDVKLIAALAIWLGRETPWMVVAAAILGLAVLSVLRPVDRRLPFGPCIAISGLGLGGLKEAGLWSM